MTAEIAVLNKTAVSLATDSAVTITTGSTEQKIYDSADKLFELSRKNPIGIMINNGMQFMQIPFQTLIHDFREKCDRFDHVEDAASAFLRFLNDWGTASSDIIQIQSVSILLRPLLDVVSDRIDRKIDDLIRLIREGKAKELDIEAEITRISVDVVSTFLRAVQNADASEFVGTPPRITRQRENIIKGIIKSKFGGMKDDSEQFRLLLDFCKQALLKYTGPTQSHTGIVIAGFGDKDLFPTLLSFEIDGTIFGKLKFKTTNKVDIDRNGERARVIPFAQKEMVERFLYGLDENIERNITLFCQQTVPDIRRQIMERLIMNDQDKAQLEIASQAAEAAFIEDLRSTRFEEIRSQSRQEIEDMVEFMPKPELATMAEALVNLTSIKRRVSRGFETVGGPIDVAVISRTEGFIWVKRKHYFEASLNPRYHNGVKVDSPKAAGGHP